MQARSTGPGAQRGAALGSQHKAMRVTQTRRPVNR
jgi:hypothetical protein